MHTCVFGCSAVVQGRKCLQGNMDPCTLFAPSEVLVARTKTMVDKFGTQPFIANLGHGMHPSHTPEQLKTYLDAVWQFTSK